jgi:Cu(I)/Ag(I) efflux system membrane protein CusA/SilA
VERVFGKAGRAETSTDPAPFSMMETTVMLKPMDQWRPKSPVVFLDAGNFASARFGTFGRTISKDELIEEMDRAMQVPRRDQRLDHAHQGRIDMLDHGRPHAHRHQNLWRGLKRD